MMDGLALQNLISKGWGIAARRAGQPYAVYRPIGTANPLSTRNRFIKLFATFAPDSSGAAGTSGYGNALWRGVFDSFYTRPGDYLVSKTSNFFIASQEPLQPILCIKADSVLSIERPSPTITGGYSGFVIDSAQLIVKKWPACLMAVAARIVGTLPEAHFGTWVAYLPVLSAVPQIADVVVDDLGRRFVVGAAQLSSLGWRLILRQVDG